MLFINEKKIIETLAENEQPSSERVDAVIAKALELKGLNAEETAVLLQCSEGKTIQKMLSTAKKVKEKIYGNRIVLFAPLYLSNYCANNCLYCGFRAENKQLERKALDMQELKREVETLEGQGHKRLLLVAGEHPAYIGIEYITKAVQTVYETKKERGEIRRVNVNTAPFTVGEFKQLKQAGIGTYQVFQETYHSETYKKMHVSGKKADYEWRLAAMDRAQQAGIDDVGIGALFGLCDYKFEVLALLQHAEHLQEKFGTGPHTISVPRIEPALNAPAALQPPAPVSDDEFKKIIAVLRLSVPYTGMILSTRENAETRNELINYGVSQISAGSRTNPGGYTENEKKHFPEAEQFSLGDTRELDEVVRELMKQGFAPSFCTGCYRSGRTGEKFMQLAKPGDIQQFCTPNSLFTLKEYLEDYAKKETKRIGEELIAKQLEQINNEKTRQLTKQKLEQIERGQRDVYI
ncbi:[FeFe] hydrogenase H-cluster radical SAM maturase HydG [Candidatus Micrarchaeota archaeon]|nr:[FeFe] hydrogenase H-cluster radical SAM maturase HydG [Candidatus Micrarchaeota archaeon]